ncbi:ANL family adenylate-forming protein [Shewanella sp. SM32]|uniref:ANL family adenylate-forming protein n=1 Tax=Shewanella sp. SM32 TaxID=2912796 RepID=UPI0021D7E58F|nr:fatty acid--CoA ligase family protein [Shewanella sp. SM32]MCU8069533.1 fatty acid--CoA ligase family protein [Shewanella sp. SM32]
MSWFIEHFRFLADKPAIVDSQGAFTYAQLATQIDVYKNYLDVQFDDSQVVVILSDYNFNAVALFFALLQKKSIIAPIVSNNKEEIDKRFCVVNPDFIIKLNDHGEVHVENKSNDLDRHQMLQTLCFNKQPGLVLFSSGSTGEPKAMIHNLDSLANSYQGKKQKNINMLVFLMFDHIGGLNTLLNTLAMGAKVVFPNTRNPDDIAALIEAHQIHVLPSSPTFLNMMLMARVQERFNLSSLKMITYGTESMPESLLKKIKMFFPRTKLLQTFGTSETGIAQTSSRSSDSLQMKFDDPNLECKIVDGELWLKSKTQVIGYLNASMECFTDDGWFKTGDLVEELDSGYLKIKGRAKEIINVGGEKVLPAEVESVILELDIVDDCMVYSEKNSITGQMVAVQIVLHDGALEKEAKKTIQAYCRTKLDTYKVPARFKFVDKTSFGERFKKLRLK